MLASVADDSRRVLRGTLMGRPWWAGPRLVLLCSPIAGAAVGSYSADEPSRSMFMVYSAIKMPLLILGTATLCLPGFFVLHVVLGLRREFPAALRSVLGGQAMFAIVLASLSPLIPVWYSAIDSVRIATLGCGALFALAALASLHFVRRAHSAVLPRQRVHGLLLACWFGLYALVGIQLAWMLRPFVGSPGYAPSFLRDDALTNGYVVVLRMLFGG